MLVWLVQPGPELVVREHRFEPRDTFELAQTGLQRRCIRSLGNRLLGFSEDLRQLRRLQPEPLCHGMGRKATIRRTKILGGGNHFSGTGQGIGGAWFAFHLPLFEQQMLGKRLANAPRKLVRAESNLHSARRQRQMTQNVRQAERIWRLGTGKPEHDSCLIRRGKQ